MVVIYDGRWEIEKCMECGKQYANIMIIGFGFQDHREKPAGYFCKECAAKLACILLQDLSDLTNGLKISQANTGRLVVFLPHNWPIKKGEPNIIRVEFVGTPICMQDERGEWIWVEGR